MFQQLKPLRRAARRGPATNNVSATLSNRGMAGSMPRLFVNLTQDVWETMGSPEYGHILVDTSRRLIMIKPAPETDANAYKFGAKGSKSKHGRRIGCTTEIFGPLKPDTIFRFEVDYEVRHANEPDAYLLIAYSFGDLALELSLIDIEKEV